MLGSVNTMEPREFEGEDDQIKPLEGCWCKGAKHIMKLEGMSELMACFNSSIEEIKSSIAEVKSSIAEVKPSVLEEVQKALNQILVLRNSVSPTASSLPHQTESSASKRFKLQFKGVPNPLLTWTKLEDEHEGTSVVVEFLDDSGKRVVEGPIVELVDDSGKRVVDGPESCLKIKIDVLDHFQVEDNIDWTEEDYTKRITKPRDIKAGLLLLKGKCEMKLNKGVASIGHLCFTDNSSSMRTRTFKLGAIAENCPSVKVAVSEALRVKERRLKTGKKHKKPSGEDDLWRLVGISKNGPVYDRALKAGIRTVKDFLISYDTNAKELQNILDVRETSWKKLVENAKACKLPDVADESYRNNNAAVSYVLQSLDQQGREQLIQPQQQPQLPAMSPVLSPPDGDFDAGGLWNSSNAGSVTFNQVCSTQPTIAPDTAAIGMDNDIGLVYENSIHQVADYGTDHTTFCYESYDDLQYLTSISGNLGGIGFAQENYWHNSPTITAEDYAAVELAKHIAQTSCGSNKLSTNIPSRLYIIVKRIILAKRVVSHIKRTREIDCRSQKKQKI